MLNVTQIFCDGQWGQLIRRPEVDMWCDVYIDGRVNNKASHTQWVPVASKTDASVIYPTVIFIFGLALGVHAKLLTFPDNRLWAQSHPEVCSNLPQRKSCNVQHVRWELACYASTMSRRVAEPSGRWSRLVFDGDDKNNELCEWKFLGHLRLEKLKDKILKERCPDRHSVCSLCRMTKQC